MNKNIMIPVAALLISAFQISHVEAQERLFGNGRFLKKVFSLEPPTFKPPQLKLPPFTKPKFGGAQPQTQVAPGPSKPPGTRPASDVAGKSNSSRAPTPAARTNPRTGPTPARPDTRPVATRAPAPQPKSVAPARTPKAGEIVEKSLRSNKKVTYGFGMLVEKRSNVIHLTRIDPRGNAAKAGLVAGDVIAKFGGVPVETLDEINEISEVLKDGDQIEVVYKRRGKSGKTLVQMGDAPDPADLVAPGEPGGIEPLAPASRPSPASRTTSAMQSVLSSSQVEKPTRSSYYSEPKSQQLIQSQEAKIEAMQAELDRLRATQKRPQLVIPEADNFTNGPSLLGPSE